MMSHAETKAVLTCGCVLLLTPLYIWLIQWIWNAVSVGLFHANPIDYWTAAGIYLLLCTLDLVMRGPAHARRTR